MSPSSTTSSSYREPSDVLQRLFLPPQDPSLILSSDHEWLVLTQEPPLPSIDLLARSEEKLAGLRFDPALLCPSRMDYASSLVLQHIRTGATQSLELPTNSEGIRWVRFHPTRPYFVFASKVSGESRFELYVCELTEGGKWYIREISLGGRRMNFIRGCAYQFIGSSSTDDLFVKMVPEGLSDCPPEEPTSTGPAIQYVEKGAKQAPARTYQDMLKNEYDAAKLRYYLTVEILLVDASSTNSLGRQTLLSIRAMGGNVCKVSSRVPVGDTYFHS